MKQAKSPPTRRIASINGAISFIVLLLIVQMWLLTATLDAYLAGHFEVVVPGMLISLLCFLCCAALYLFVVRLDR